MFDSNQKIETNNNFKSFMDDTGPESVSLY